ncbi:MAG: VUT family protein [Hyphomicrobiaceae bacterium]
MTGNVDAIRWREGLVFLALFTLSIPAANWMIGHVGTLCPPDSPCLVPVAPGLMAPSGVIMVGFALVMRDLVQRRLGLLWSVLAVLAGGLVSWAIAPPALALASVVAFLVSEFADLAVYTPLQRRGLVLAVVASGLVGLLVDTVVFLKIAFGSLDFMAGQIVGKGWMILLALPVIAWIRRRDERIGLTPAGATP